MKICFVNRKGGSGKTTSSVFTSLVLAEGGAKTLLIDAESMGSALAWSVRAEALPFTTIQLPVDDVHKRIPRFASDYEHIVIDNPAAVKTVSRSSLRGSDVAIIPLSPSMADIDRLNNTLELVQEVQDIHDNLSYYLLFTRVHRGTISAREGRAALLEHGLPLLEAEIPRLERYANALGTVPSGDELEHYRDVVAEVIAREASK